MSSSSDSDEEEKSRLADAVFGAVSSIKNQAINSNREKNEKKVHPPRISLRTDGDENQVSAFQATPECKQFIARKLDEYLDSEICDIIITSSTGIDQDNHKDYGINLLSKSLRKITGDKFECDIKSKKKLLKKRTVSSSSEDDDEDIKRFQLAAVSHDFVIKSTGIKKHQEENQKHKMKAEIVKKGEKKHSHKKNKSEEE